MSNHQTSPGNEAKRRWPVPFVIGFCVVAGAAGFLLGSSRPAPDSAASHASDVSAAANAPAQKTNSARVVVAHSRDTNAVPAWQDRWRAALAGRKNPARTRELAALIEELARIDHEQALAIAADNDNWRIRDVLKAAALRGWASVAPDAAGDFALKVRPEDRRAAVAAVLEGTAGAPEATVRLALHFCEANPKEAGDYGHAAVAALVDAGSFADAVKFGQQVGTEKYPFLLKSAFFQWARNQPKEALAACDQLEDAAQRSRAREEIISGWAWAEPEALAQYALKAQSPDDRKGALNEALPLWMERDPEAAINWINSNNSGPEFDAGVAAAANLQSFIVGQPDTAMDLAGRVSDPALRKHTMRAVFRQWALADLDGARSYAKGRVNAADRTLLETEIEDLAHQ